MGQIIHAKPDQSRRKIEHLCNAGRLFQLLFAQALHETDDLIGKVCLDLWATRLEDRKLSLAVGITDMRIEAAPPQSIRQVPRAIGRQDHDRARLGCNSA